MKEIEKNICSACGGTGKCTKCAGAGHVLHDPPTPITVVSGTIRSERQTGTSRKCPRCYGSGTCQKCKGTGKEA
jgi:hypothetical protein